jgi:hypothetical protein
MVSDCLVCSAEKGGNDIPVGANGAARASGENVVGAQITFQRGAAQQLEV